MENNYQTTNKIENYLDEYRNWSVWRAIILGQILSLCVCLLGYMSHYLANTSQLQIPTGQNYIHYVLLCAVFTTSMAFRHGDKGLISILKKRGYRYILIGLIDVQANTLLATSHQYTTLTSIQLLDCVAIPVTLALSCLVLGVRFRFVHILGVSVCLMGVGCLVWTGIGKSSNELDNQNQLVGDMFCLGGAVLFSVISILQELTVKTLDCVEFLGMLGLSGSLICGVQIFLLEKNTIIGVSWENRTVLIYLACFALVQFIFKSILSYVLKESGATAVQLYLLTADFYTLIVGIVFKNYKFHALYFLSYLLTMSGIYIFAIKRTPIAAQQQSSRNTNNEVITRQEGDVNYMIEEEEEERNNSSAITREYSPVPYILSEDYEMIGQGVLHSSLPTAELSISTTSSTAFSSFYK